MKNFKHLKDYDLTYWDHFKQAIRYYTIVQKAALYLLMHSVWPDIYQDKASKTLINLIKEFDK